MDVPDSPGLVIFTASGEVFYRSRGRGFNVASIDASTGQVLQVRNFDTWDTRDDGTQMRAFLAFVGEARPGSLLLVAVGDEAGLNTFPPDDCDHWPYPWVEEGLQILEELGSQEIRSYCYRDSWAMAAVKGEGRARAEALGKAITVSISVELVVGQS